MVLIAQVNTQSQYLGDAWVQALGPRKRDEIAFHDADRKDGRDWEVESTPNRRFYEAARHVRRDMELWINTHARDAIFLDYACGNGVFTELAANAGAELAIGIDISAVSIAEATKRANSNRSRFLQRDCEDTGLPDASIDACLCSGMLHHLDLAKAFPELARIMKPGGQIYCQEALGYNPFIRLYRRLTPQLRTAWEREHILTHRHLRYAKRWFRVQNVRYYLIAAPLATLLPSPL